MLVAWKSSPAPARQCLTVRGPGFEATHSLQSAMKRSRETEIPPPRLSSARHEEFQLQHEHALLTPLQTEATDAYHQSEEGSRSQTPTSEITHRPLPSAHPAAELGHASLHGQWPIPAHSGLLQQPSSSHMHASFNGAACSLESSMMRAAAMHAAGPAAMHAAGFPTGHTMQARAGIGIVPVPVCYGTSHFSAAAIPASFPVGPQPLGGYDPRPIMPAPIDPGPFMPPMHHPMHHPMAFMPGPHASRLAPVAPPREMYPAAAASAQSVLHMTPPPGHLQHGPAQMQGHLGMTEQQVAMLHQQWSSSGSIAHTMEPGAPVQHPCQALSSHATPGMLPEQRAPLQYQMPPIDRIVHLPLNSRETLKQFVSHTWIRPVVLEKQPASASADGNDSGEPLLVGAARFSADAVILAMDAEGRVHTKRILGRYTRPPGRAPKGKQWSTEKGIWE